MCRMTYEWQARLLQFTQPPGLNVSLSWTGVSGTTISNSADPTRFSGTLETNMTIDNLLRSTISSYNCTITFSFSPGFDRFHQYAVNPLSYTCQPSPVSRKLDISLVNVTRSSAIAEGPRDASCQLKSWQLPICHTTHTHTHPFNGPFSRTTPGEPVPER